MAVVMSMLWQGITPDDYEQAREAVGCERDPPPGGQHHTAAELPPETRPE